MPERASPEMKIFGMTGLPVDFIEMDSYNKGKEYWTRVLRNEKIKKNRKNVKNQNEEKV